MRVCNMPKKPQFDHFNIETKEEYPSFTHNANQALGSSKKEIPNKDPGTNDVGKNVPSEKVGADSLAAHVRTDFVEPDDRLR